MTESQGRPMPFAMLRCMILISSVAFIAFAAVGCWSPSVRTSVDPQADFRSLKTYSIVPNTQKIIAIRMLDGQPMAKTIEQSIGRALDARGRVPAATPEQAQMLVRWTGNIEYDAPGRG